MIIFQNLFVQRNVGSLLVLGAADILIDTCLQLPHLARYIHKYNNAILKKGFSLPSTLSEAQQIRHRFVYLFLKLFRSFFFLATQLILLRLFLIFEMITYLFQNFFFFVPSLQYVATDLNIVWNAVSLPVLEPLTPSRLEKLSIISMSALYCALSAATACSVFGVYSAVTPKTVPSSNTGK